MLHWMSYRKLCLYEAIRIACCVKSFLRSFFLSWFQRLFVNYLCTLEFDAAPFHLLPMIPGWSYKHTMNKIYVAFLSLAYYLKFTSAVLRGPFMWSSNKKFQAFVMTGWQHNPHPSILRFWRFQLIDKVFFRKYWHDVISNEFKCLHYFKHRLNDKWSRLNALIIHFV